MLSMSDKIPKIELLLEMLEYVIQHNGHCKFSDIKSRFGESDSKLFYTYAIGSSTSDKFVSENSVSYDLTIRHTGILHYYYLKEKQTSLQSNQNLTYATAAMAAATGVLMFSSVALLLVNSLTSFASLLTSLKNNEMPSLIGALECFTLFVATISSFFVSLVILRSSGVNNIFTQKIYYVVAMVVSLLLFLLLCLAYVISNSS